MADGRERCAHEHDARTSSEAERLVPGLLAGDIRALSRMLTLVESEEWAMHEALDRLYAKTGHARVIGLTGVPGAGKSTLIARLAVALRERYPKVAVLAIDPSSPLTSGAILGDRVRMNALTQDPGIYIRSMATRGAVGGLSRAAYDAIDVLDVAGYDIVMVETVGVGQGEFEIANAVDTTIVVSAPGLGDEVQAIKAGILEMADIHLVNKVDRPDAQKTIADIRAMLAIAGSRRRPRVPLVAASAETGQGIPDLLEAISEHFEELRRSSYGKTRRTARCEQRVLRAAEDIVARRIRKDLRERGQAFFEQVYAREESPRSAAQRLLREIEF